MVAAVTDIVMEEEEAMDIAMAAAKVQDTATVMAVATITTTSRPTKLTTSRPATRLPTRQLLPPNPETTSHHASLPLVLR